MKTLIRKNIHTHTIRCGHAIGSDRQYVEAAIASGYEELGFSDHCYRNEINTGEYYNYFSYQEDKYIDYVNSINALRKEYQNQIKIYLGLEVEFIPSCFDEALAYYKKTGVEYLILGQHACLNEQGDKLVYAGRKNSSIESFDRYIEECLEAMKLGCFSYLAHPDLFNFVGEEEIYLEKMKYFVSMIKKYQIPIEFNCHGFLNHKHYPNDLFWNLIAKEKIPAILGIDAHDPKELANSEGIQKCLDYLNNLNIEIIEPTINYFNK